MIFLREYIKKIAKGEISQQGYRLGFHPETIEEVRPCGKGVTGTVHLLCEEQEPMKGLVYSSDYRVELKNSQFAGTGAVLDYQIREEYTHQAAVIKGRFHIVCTGGEYDLPYQFTFSQTMALGESFDLLEQFASFASGSRDEALRIFDSGRFPALPFMQDLGLCSLYDGLRFQNDRQAGMEEFLVASGGKERVSLTVNEEERVCRLKSDEETEDGILIERSGRGYLKLQIKAEGEFISLEKNTITDDDFTGKQTRISYRILGRKLYTGKNTGRITISSLLYRFQIPITVYKGERKISEAGKEKLRLAYLRTFLAEAGLRYQSHRERLVTEAAYQKLKMAYGRLTGDYGEETPDIRITLFQCIAASQWEPEEGRRLLDSVTDDVLMWRIEEPGNYCLYLYGKKLLGEGEESGTTLNVILKKYDGDGLSDPAVLLLLILNDRSQSDHPAMRWEKIRTYYERGCRSPWLYLAAYFTLREDERLLRFLDELTMAALWFGIRQGLMTKRLADGTAALAMKKKNAGFRELELLKSLYRKYKTKELLSGVLSLMIKSDQREPECFDYYQEGVRQELKLTRLYDYYLYTMPSAFEGPLPRPLLLYFSYQQPADHEARTRLYLNIIQNKGRMQDIYQSYAKEMEVFAVDQMLKGRISRELSRIYRELIYPEMLDERAGKIFPAMLCAREFSCENPEITHVIFCYEDRRDEMRFALREQKACVPVYGDHFRMIFQDGYGNRYGQIPCRLEPLMEDCDDLLQACFQVDQSQPEYFYNRLRAIYDSGQVSREDVWILERGVSEKKLRDLFRRKLTLIGIQYYLSLPSQEKCDNFAAVADPAILDGDARKLLLELLVTKGYYEEAYQIVENYGYRDIRPGRLLKLCHYIIERYGGFNDYLIRLTHHLFIEDKLDNVILEYLCQYYNGSSERMYSILEVSKNSHVNLWDLPERLLAQLIFVRNGQWVDQVFFIYMKQGTVDSALRDAYFVLKSWGYVRRMWELPEETAWYMEQKAGDRGEPRRPSLIESLAMTRYYDSLPELNERQKELCRLYMERFTEKGMIFAHFPGLSAKAGCLTWMENRYLAEYQAEEGERLNIRIQILPAAAPPIQGKMVHVFQGIFTYEVTLFYGEQAEYEIYRDKEQKQAAASGTLTVDISDTAALTERNAEKADAGGGVMTRYQAINRLLAAAEAQDAELERQMLEYGKRLELSDRLFRLL